MLAATLLALLTLLAVVLVGGCGQSSTGGEFHPVPRPQQGEPRGFLLGLSAVPATLNDDAYRSAFDLAANYGEVLLVQRTPSWGEFTPGSRVSSQLRAATARERDAAQARGLRLFVALDVFDPTTRDRLAGLPASQRSRGLDDPALRQALVAEATFIAVNERPAYLAIGMEINAAYERSPLLYQQYVTAYREAYQAVKTVSPQTQVFPTFQYEQLLGVIPSEPPHAPRWNLLDGFQGAMDAFAITTYPSFAYQVARKVPPRYYHDAKDHTKLPLLIAAAGYASAVSRDNLNSATEPEQRRYLERLLTDAGELRIPLVVWFAGRDPAFAANPPLDLVGSIGLRTASDRPKEAWQVWEEASRRPYDASRLTAPEPTATTSGGGG